MGRKIFYLLFLLLLSFSYAETQTEEIRDNQGNLIGKIISTYDEEKNLTKEEKISILPDGYTYSQITNYFYSKEKKITKKETEIYDGEVLVEEYSEEYFSDNLIKKTIFDTNPYSPTQIKKIYFEKQGVLIKQITEEYSKENNLIRKTEETFYPNKETKEKAIISFTYENNLLISETEEQYRGTTLQKTETKQYIYNEKSQIVKANIQTIPYMKTNPPVYSEIIYSYSEDGKLEKTEWVQNSIKTTNSYIYSEQGNLVSKKSENFRNEESFSYQTATVYYSETGEKTFLVYESYSNYNNQEKRQIRSITKIFYNQAGEVIRKEEESNFSTELHRKLIEENGKRIDFKYNGKNQIINVHYQELSIDNGRTTHFFQKKNNSFFSETTSFEELLNQADYYHKQSIEFGENYTKEYMEYYTIKENPLLPPSLSSIINFTTYFEKNEQGQRIIKKRVEERTVPSGTSAYLKETYYSGDAGKEYPVSEYVFSLDKSTLYESTEFYPEKQQIKNKKVYDRLTGELIYEIKEGILILQKIKKQELKPELDASLLPDYLTDEKLAFEKNNLLEKNQHSFFNSCFSLLSAPTSRLTSETTSLFKIPQLLNWEEFYFLSGLLAEERFDFQNEIES